MISLKVWSTSYAKNMNPKLNLLKAHKEHPRHHLLPQPNLFKVHKRQPRHCLLKAQSAQGPRGDAMPSATHQAQSNQVLQETATSLPTAQSDQGSQGASKSLPTHKPYPIKHHTRQPHHYLLKVQERQPHHHLLPESDLLRSCKGPSHSRAMSQPRSK